METSTVQDQESKPEVVHDYEGLPPSPPGPCNEVVAKRFAALFDYKARSGINMNDHILNRKDFKNPAIYEKLKEDFGIDEYGSNYLNKDGDNIVLDPSDYYDILGDENKPT